jgi:hypothetical protein
MYIDIYIYVYIYTYIFIFIIYIIGNNPRKFIDLVSSLLTDSLVPLENNLTPLQSTDPTHLGPNGAIMPSQPTGQTPSTPTGQTLSGQTPLEPTDLALSQPTEVIPLSTDLAPLTSCDVISTPPLLLYSFGLVLAIETLGKYFCSLDR